MEHSETLRPKLPSLVRQGWIGAGRFLAYFALALIAFAGVLLLAGKDPIQAYSDILSYSLGSGYGLSEVLVRMIPLLLTAVAVALPARMGLINVGGEGQLYMGALFATWGALTFPSLPAWLLLPLMIVLGFVGGGFWAAIPALLRVRGLVGETLSTLLLNYVAVLIVNFFLFGPWRDAKSAYFPQSPQFVDAAKLPHFGATRIHFGLVLALIAVVAFAFVISRTRWGLEMRAIGGNPAAALRNGIPIGRYIMLIMFISGGIAGLAGMGEASAIQGRLTQGISPGYGFIGFLIAWLAGANPWSVLVMSFFLAVISSGGDILQISQGLPFSVVNILMALILFVVLAWRPRKAGAL
jgi:ABC-type uncharacterized transport system permease subunit